MLRRLVVLITRLAGIVFLLAAASFAQSDASVSVTGDVQNPMKLTLADLTGMPRAAVATTNNGVVTSYAGVWLMDVLKKAGLPASDNMAGYVVASAVDGYQVVFSLGELDPTVTDGQYLLADKANAKPLSGRDGTFRLVVAKDIRGVRSVRQLAQLHVVLLRK